MNAKRMGFVLPFFLVTALLLMTACRECRGHNPTCRRLTFNEYTFNEFKENIPVFLKEVGYKFETVVKDDVMTLVFEPVPNEES